MAVFPLRPRMVPKPWGYELVWAETLRYAGKILHIEQGKALSLQYHVEKDETLYVLTGRIELFVGSSESTLERIELVPGQGFHVHPYLFHRVRALETSDVLEASTPELEDVVRVRDDFGRA
ncbi:MAG: hypothetical protein KatS3mg076_1108 [Candidatus Binatia bacterium]|nr:MAG: hypothetical protein KatS3mg076_1108 [Candidatus Binatia bacterium]